MFMCICIFFVLVLHMSFGFVSYTIDRLMGGGLPLINYQLYMKRNQKYMQKHTTNMQIHIFF